MNGLIILGKSSSASFGLYGWIDSHYENTLLVQQGMSSTIHTVLLIAISTNARVPLVAGLAHLDVPHL